MFNPEKEAAALVAEMTLEEKVSQMLHTSPAIDRLDIPSYNWWSEALHGVARAGVATMFPQAIGLAATFDEEILSEVAEVIATEGRAKFNAFQEEEDHDIYKGLTFWSPNINIFRDPRWGRGHETYGEDPYLTARLGVAYIKGLQQKNAEQLKTAACAKHFAVHSGPESERHEFNAVCDDYDLWNTYLPAFESAVKEAEVEAVMGAYNRTLGEPCCGSKLLLEDILRKKWGFKGHVVSDCWAIKDFHENHRVTNSPVESVALAISRGCDVNCGNMFVHAVDAVEKGLLTEEQIDQAVTRLLATRMRLGLLGAPENPAYSSIPFEEVDSPEHAQFNLKTAKRSLVLLKNDGTLPLNVHSIKTIGVIGPNADNRRALEGNYEGQPSHPVTPLMGIQNLAEKEGVRVLFAQGCHLYKDRMTELSMADDRMAEARAVARRSDAIVLFLGLDAGLEGEEGDAGNEFGSGDKPNLKLPGRQEALLREVTEAADGKPVIVVLISGSALSVEYADENAGAVVQAFYPGACGGTALAELIFGRFSPEGKLPLTFYRNTDDLPDFRDYNMTGRTYRYFKGEALYPFGFGLGYSSFTLNNLQADKEKCTVTVKNTGKMSAGETVQVYVESPEQKETWNLCGIAKVRLSASESTEVTVNLNPNAFARYDAEGNVQTIAGKHILHVGFTQPDERSVSLTGQRPLQTEITV
ncbi:glycoside hydrolase family 3 C-terminal domain-containing protein [Scatolibacter rhodanostii]|uniref:glycoside hydrolase family 3 C-terminal domain-containing protein n=1 Tax=Scatolibacter rhodanostii TaxID=2014781 RepID=UPI000C071347|nr:glycoside hydrolase family 3 N-terminal domain-containing protein [Scatolibacter rhodanostii]